MRIHVSKSEESLEFEVDSESDLDEIKQVVSEKTNIPPELQQITYLADELGPQKDSRVLVQEIAMENPQSPKAQRPPKKPVPIVNFFPSEDFHNFPPNSPTAVDPWLEKAVTATLNNDTYELHCLLEEYSKYRAINLNQEDITDIINCPHEKKWCCIHYACEKGHKEILSELLSLGANCNVVTMDFWTPLQLSVANNHFECVELLVSHPNIQINKMTTERGTPLHIACEKGNAKIVDLLLDCDAAVRLEDPNGKIPLQLTKKSSILEKIPKYIGEKILEKYGRSNEVEPPPSFSGQVCFSAPWQINDKLVFLVLNVSEKCLLHYRSREAFIEDRIPDVKTKINSIHDVRNYIAFNKYFFVVETQNRSYKYYCEYPDMTHEWTKAILKAVQYFQLTEQKTSVCESFCEQRRESVNYMEFEEEGQEDNFEPVNSSSFATLGVLGKGSFGKVLKVLKQNSGNVYALKVLNKIKLKRNHQLKYAVAECKILKSIRHPFIVSLYWAFQTPKQLYMVLEMCPNGDLDTLLKQVRCFTSEQAKNYIAQVILAVEYLHSLDIIYRDLKPMNILIDEEGYIKLTDFGLAKENVTQKNPAMSFCGSPAYLAPELINSTGAWKPVDVYAIGANLYEMLAGQPPFYTDNLNILFKRITSARLRFPSHMTTVAKNLIQTLMHRSPEKRPSIAQIKQHPFFEDMDWEALYQKRIPPPFTSEFFCKKQTSLDNEKIDGYSMDLTLEECLLDFEI